MVKHLSPTSDVFELRPDGGEQVEHLVPVAHRMSISSGLGLFHDSQQTAGFARDGSVMTAHSQFIHAHTGSRPR